MKAIKVFAALTLVAAMLAMPVFAAETVPSIEYKDGVQYVSADFGEDHAHCCKLLIVPIFHVNLDEIIDEIEYNIDDDISEEMEGMIRTSLKNALQELKSNSLEDIVDGFADAWVSLTGGAPLENAIVTDLFEVVRICSEEGVFQTEGSVAFSFKVDGIKAGDTFMIIHKPTGYDKWVVEEYTVDESGVITMTVDKLSPFAIVKDSGKAPVATVTSPQTGVTEFTAVATVLGMAALAVGGVVVGKKFRKTNAQ